MKVKLTPEELAEAKQIQSAIRKGVVPPPCKNKQECDIYCDDPSNIKVCVAFGEAAGFLKGKDLEDAKKMINAIENGAIPPPCKGRKACEDYCSQPDNMEACMNFAREAGFMSPEEAKESEKVLSAIKKGAKPPACRGKEEARGIVSAPASRWFSRAVLVLRRGIAGGFEGSGFPLRLVHDHRARGEH